MPLILSPGHKLRKPSKKSGLAYFSHLAPLICSLFLLKSRVKKGGLRRNVPPLNALLPVGFQPTKSGRVDGKGFFYLPILVNTSLM